MSPMALGKNILFGDFELNPFLCTVISNASSVNLTNVKYNTNIYTLLQERKMPSGEDEARGLSMTFTSTSRHHSGFYTCSADNGFGRATNATITLDVQRKC